jgi:type III secretory pathway lipoprotein EscJ
MKCIGIFINWAMTNPISVLVPERKRIRRASFSGAQHNNLSIRLTVGSSTVYTTSADWQGPGDWGFESQKKSTKSPHTSAGKQKTTRRWFMLRSNYLF